MIFASEKCKDLAPPGAKPLEVFTTIEGFQEDLRNEGNNKIILSRAFGFVDIAGVEKPCAALLRPRRWQGAWKHSTKPCRTDRLYLSPWNRLEAPERLMGMLSEQMKATNRPWSSLSAPISHAGE